MFIFLLLINSIIPLMMISFGKLWKKHPPPGINWVYGYRSSMSMKNDETWKFAHSHNARVWLRTGSIWLIISLVLMILFRKHLETISLWVNIIGFAILLVSLLATEIALRKNFDKDGNRR